MNTEIWLAVIAGVVTIFAPILLMWAKVRIVAKTTEKTAKTTEKTAQKVDETHDLVNGQSTELKKMYERHLEQADLLAQTQKRLEVIEAFARGKAEGKSDAENNAPATDP